MTSFKLKEDRAVFVKNMEAILELATTEERDLSSEEQQEWEGFNAEIESIDKKITIAERQEELNKSIASSLTSAQPTKEDKELRDYSFQDAMRQSVSGKLSGLVKEMDTEARMAHPSQLFRGIAIPSAVLEHRAITANHVRATETMSFTDQLEANLVLASAGANFYGGVNDMKFPVISGITSSFVAEYPSDVASAGNTGSLTLTPKKLISVVDMSAESMTQNAGLEGAIRRNMASSVASTLEKALLTGGSDITSAPESIFTDAGAGATAVTASDWLALEKLVLGNNVPLEGARMAYLMNNNALNIVKTLAQVANVSPIYDNVEKMLNGYFSLMSQNVGNGGADFATKAFALFGDFSRCHIAQFGGIDILFDPYTKSRQGVGSLVVTSLVDGNTTDGATAFASLIEA